MNEELEVRNELQATNSELQTLNRAIREQVLREEKLDQLANKMPRPDFMEVSAAESLALAFTSSQSIALTTSWQWVLAKIGEALMVRDARIIKLLFSEVDYAQLNHNAVEDIRTIVRQPVEENALRAAQVKVESLQKSMNEYLHQTQLNRLQLNSMIDEFGAVIQQLKSLEVVGVGGFMLASGSRLALLQEKALLDRSEWSVVKFRALEDSEYASRVTPKVFKLSVGQIDKTCRCTKWQSREESERITQYECRYSDGKDLHIFRSISPDAVIECNKHRLRMFASVTASVNQTIAKPVRSALNQWRELAASI